MMANEVAQWACIVIVAFLMLGVVRRLTLLLPARARANAPGPRVGERFRGL